MAEPRRRGRAMSPAKLWSKPLECKGHAGTRHMVLHAIGERSGISEVERPALARLKRHRGLADKGVARKRHARRLEAGAAQNRRRHGRDPLKRVLPAQAGTNGIATPLRRKRLQAEDRLRSRVRLVPEA